MTAVDPKYGRVRIEAVQRCEACRGTGVDGRTTSGPRQPIRTSDAPCPICDGAGERRTSLLHDGEPFFLVRGQDQLAPVLVAAYAALYANAHGQSAHDWPDVLVETLTQIEAWQLRNPGLVKRPD